MKMYVFRGNSEVNVKGADSFNIKNTYANYWFINVVIMDKITYYKKYVIECLNDCNLSN